MKKFTFLFVTSAFISAFYLKPLLAQTELMKDVDAVDEKSEDDLYAPEDEAVTPDSKAASNSKEKKASPKVEAPPPTEEAIMKVTPTLDELPVTTKPKAAMTGVVESSESAQLTSIKSYAMDDRVRYEIQTSRVVDFAPETSNSTKKFTLNLADTTIGPLVSKGPVKSDSNNSPVDKFQATESKSDMGNYTQVIMDLNTLTEPVIRREGNRLLLDFFTNKAGPYQRSEAKLNAELPSYETLISLDSKSNFVGSKVNFNAKEASVPSVLQFISQVSGKNFVLVDQTDKKISINVKNVPWDQVLAFVLLNAELGYQKIGNTYRVMTVSKIRSDITDNLKAQEDEYKLQAKATQLFPLSYAKASETIPQIDKFLRKDYGESSLFDERTNSIVITALPKNIQRVRKFIEAVDRQTPVVEIEARIVQAKKTFSKDIGLNWKTFGTFGIANGNLNIGGGLGGKIDTLVDATKIPAQTGIGGSYVGTSGTLRALDTFLKASEEAKYVKELSRPSLTVLNNKSASLVDGTETTFILQGNAQEASTSKTVQAALSLDVTPQVTNDNNILLNISLKRDSFGAKAADGKSTDVDKRQVTTQTLIESGKTVVIGGVYIKEDTNGDSGLPFLRKIPFFGSLLTATKSKLEGERELLMFISPRILNLDKASINQQTLEEAR